jgi:hypothetical protein
MEFKLNYVSAGHKTPPPSTNHLVWLVLVLLASAFALGDTAVVAWYADVVSTAEVIAYGFAFALISIGLLVTAGTVRHLS